MKLFGKKEEDQTPAQPEDLRAVLERFDFSTLFEDEPSGLLKTILPIAQIIISVLTLIILLFK